MAESGKVKLHDIRREHAHATLRRRFAHERWMRIKKIRESTMSDADIDREEKQLIAQAQALAVEKGMDPRRIGEGWFRPPINPAGDGEENNDGD